ncbi:D-alanyl-D-alanine carboxypeptidase family protein [Pseudomonas sp. Y24-6]|uniref:D-alanyl-D-alanine carboxypeptidase family protein n=1 Tax=Pseudomonas sp. Y24-6 TaxID=2750013 RepID=UPI001CE082D5|nr:serine hydrolase [Pseudomonas sp. Y24-6]MCA4964923.1 D-alanyl-D-alanine carboxypeptidase [Pseudomonas sp. Y24-6]
MADQTERLELATVKAEIGSEIISRFSNDPVEADPIHTNSGEIQNLKQVAASIEADGQAAITQAVADGIVDLTAAADSASISADRSESGAALSLAASHPFPTTADGIANTSGSGATNRYFSVPVSGTTLATLYRNDANTAVKIGEAPSANAVAAIALSLENSKTVGLSTTPITGTFVTANTRIFDTAVAKSGVARKLRTYSKNAGQSITLRRFVSTGGSQLLLGDVLTQVGSDYVVPLDSSDSAKEISITFPVNAGEFIGIYGASFVYPGVTVGVGATMGQSATSGNYTSLTIGGFGTGYKWQVGLDIYSNYVNASLLSGLEISVQTLGTMAPVGVSSIYDLPPSPKGRHGVVTGSPLGSVYSDGTVWRWTRDDEPVPVPWMRILDLAKRDGWMSVYDFTNSAKVSVVQSGGIEYISAIEDALGSSPIALQATPAARPVLAGDGIGGLKSARFAGAQNLLISDSVVYNQVYCVLEVSKFSGPVDLATSTGKFAFSGRGANRPGIIGYDNAGTMTAWHGNGVAGNTLSNNPTVFGAVFEGADSTAYENGWITSVGLIAATNKLQLGYIGADYQGQRGWIGDIAALLVYLGDPGQEKVERMQKLLADVFSIPVPGLEISALGATVTRLSDMKVLYGKAPAATGHVASVTKVMTSLVLDRKVADLSQTVTVVAGDIVDSGTTLFVKAGDIISYQDLMYAALLPSDNNAATAIARAVGYIINPSAGDDTAAKAAFYAEMNAVATLLGMTETVYNNSYEGCTSNATDLTKLLAHISANAPRMLAVGSQASHTITVTGTTPRTYTITSTIYPPFFPGYAFGKTGTGDSYGSLVLLWDKDGERYASVMVRSFPSTLRYREARWLMDEAIYNPLP